MVPVRVVGGCVMVYRWLGERELKYLEGWVIKVKEFGG